jgi:hypothetical protein
VKLVQVSKSAFNHEAAEKARAWVMADYDLALAALPFVCHDLSQNEIFDNREVIQKALDIYAGPRVEAIGKAAGYWDTRNEHGEFAHTESRRTKRVKYSDTRAGRVKVTATEHPSAAGLSSRDRQHYAQALNQVADTINDAIDNGYDAADTYWRAVWRSKDGSLSITPGVGLSPQNIVDAGKFKDGQRLVEVGMTSKPTLSAGGAAYDLMSAVSTPKTAADLGDAFGRAGSVLSSPGKRDALAAGVNGYSNRSGQTGDETSTTRLFNRLRSVGTVATSVMGDNAPPQAKLAAQVATMVGTYGPEAEKVIGPTTRRASYRYRGVEKRPDARLQQIIDKTVTGELARAEKAGATPREARTLARERVVYGRNEKNAKGHEAFVESGLIQYFQNRLPNPDLYDLQRKSGTIPPSQGVIIDRHGRVAHESVGYGEDWYLPFNLKNLKALKGGEYVRTRAYGGLTTEDIYTGLVSGARSVTVVSNSGVFTLEFDDTFRGGRRLNDKAARMVSRYGHLLDTVKNGSVTIDDIERTRLTEIEDDAARLWDPEGEPQKYEAELNRLKARERRTPQLSKVKRDQIASEATNDAARDWAIANNLQPGDLHEVIAQDRAAYMKRVKALAAQYGVKEIPAAEAERAQAAFSSKWADPTSVLGVDRKIAQLEKTALDEQRRRMSTLALDGSGYDYAAQALEEQFPYYISRYESRDLRGRFDQGYVKPRFNRPEGAKTGYFDTSITGSGKKSADKTNHQNYGVRGSQMAAEVDDADEEPEPVARPAAAPATTQTLGELGKQRQAILDAAKALRTATKVSDTATGSIPGGFDVSAVAGTPIGDPKRAALRTAFPALHDPELESKVRSGDIAFTKKVADELQILHDTHLIDHDMAAALGKKTVAYPKWDDVGAVTGTGGQVYDFGDDLAPDAGGSDPQKKYEHFMRVMARDPEIRHALEFFELNKDVSIQDLPGKILDERAGEVDEYLALEQQQKDYKSDSLRYSEPSPAVLQQTLKNIRGLDKAHQAATLALAAYEASAKTGTATPATDVTERVIVSPTESEARAAAASVIRAGGTPEIAGPLPTPAWDALLASALGEPVKEPRT